VDPRVNKTVRITPIAGRSSNATLVKGAEAVVQSVSLDDQSFLVRISNRFRPGATDTLTIKADECTFLDLRFVRPASVTPVPSRPATQPSMPRPPSPLTGGSTPAWTSTPDITLAGTPWAPDPEDDASMGKPPFTLLAYLAHSQQIFKPSTCWIHTSRPR
jgi:hypothetical protein